MHLSDLVSQPRSVLRNMCESLSGIECSDDYLETCAGKVFKSLSRTRSLVEWSQGMKENVARNEY